MRMAAVFFGTAKLAKCGREVRKENPKWNWGGSFPQVAVGNVHPTLTEKNHGPMISPKYDAVCFMDGGDDH
jgi:hypothetical protein